MIGILTYHTGYNYGASLQAYALQTVLSKMGYDSEIINFETKRFKASREMITLRPTRLKEDIKIITRITYMIIQREFYRQVHCTEWNMKWKNMQPIMTVLSVVVTKSGIFLKMMHLQQTQENK